ncbi:MAG TPA: glycosyltransferase [Candidatus Limnocylindrales bacterium]|nr:glycosyltransferase [Candidatus Limnocylindrales bacterium]
MNRPYVPQAVLDAAHARAAARAARDWATADRLRGEIEAAGWRVVDRGTDFRLEPAHPPDVEDEAGVRYGRSDAVPSRLGEPSASVATVVLVATDQPDDLDRALVALRANAPAGTQVVVVADAPDPDQAGRLPAPGPGGEAPVELEVVRTSARLGWAAAVNIGLRCATGEVVVVMDTSVEPTGDVVTPLVDALRDPEVGVAGPFGLRSADLRRFDEIERGHAAAIEGYLLGFRRADAIAAGPLDEAFRFYRNADIWWSLVLRDRGAGEAPRRAVVVGGLPLIRHEHRGWTSIPEGERERLSKRNFYRLLDRFRDRPDLAVPEGEPGAAPRSA